MLKAEDLGDYYRIPADNRDLNYENYFSQGINEGSNMVEYNSHNTERLGVKEMKSLLLKIPEIYTDKLISIK